MTDFGDEEPTKPIAFETLAETAARWDAERKAKEEENNTCTN